MGLYYEDFEVGTVYTTQSRTVTETEIVIYSGLSGDFNPLHTDEEYSKTTPYGTRIAHGPLVLAIAMGLLNRLGLTDGTSLGFLGINEWKFTGPVKAGDTVTVRVTIADKRMASRGARGILTRHIEVVNQRNEVVQRGSMASMVEAKPEAPSAAAD